jgi:hypothetical protein
MFSKFLSYCLFVKISPFVVHHLFPYPLKWIEFLSTFSQLEMQGTIAGLVGTDIANDLSGRNLLALSYTDGGEIAVNREVAAVANNHSIGSTDIDYRTNFTVEYGPGLCSGASGQVYAFVVECHPP